MFKIPGAANNPTVPVAAVSSPVSTTAAVEPVVRPAISNPVASQPSAIEAVQKMAGGSNTDADKPAEPNFIEKLKNKPLNPYTGLYGQSGEEKRDYSITGGKGKVGLFNAFSRGLPNENQVTNSYGYDPDYEPDIGESIASSVSQFARSGVQAGMDLWNPDMANARAQIAQLRITSPQAADALEGNLLGGKRADNVHLGLKLGASVLEGALTLVPFFGEGRAALAAGEGAVAAGGLALGGKAGIKFGTTAASKEATALAIKAGEMTVEEGAKAVAKTAARNEIISKIYSSTANGGLYAFLYGVHSHNGSIKEGLAAIPTGAAAGAAFGVGGSVLAGASKFVGDKIVAPAGKSIVKGLTAVDDKLAKVLPEGIYGVVASVNAVGKKYYGEVGETFVQMWNGATKQAQEDVGKLNMAMIDHGMVEPPQLHGGVANDVKFVGNDEALMMDENAIMRGLGVYADPKIQAAAIAENPRLQFQKELLRSTLAKAEDLGIIGEPLNPTTYAPKHTAQVELPDSVRKKIANAPDEATVEHLYGKVDPMVKNMVNNAVTREKAFPSMAEAYRVYFDMVDVMKNTDKVPSQENTFLQWLVKTKRADSIEGAAKRFAEDVQTGKKSLTPASTSLDFKRNIDLPFYDPNMSRVLPKYANDAALRTEMEKHFRDNDELLQGLIDKVQKTGRDQNGQKLLGGDFEAYVRKVADTHTYMKGSEKASAFVRTLQVPKMAFSAIMNLGQSANTFLASDLGSTFHGLAHAFDNEQMRKNIERGIFNNSFMRDVMAYNTGGTKMADTFMKFTGQSYTETFNRAVAATASDHWAEKNLTGLLKKFGNEGAETAAKSNAPEFYALKELGLDPAEILKRGEFLLEEKALAAQTFVERTQFSSRNLDLPYWSSSPLGKVAFQFKSFGYQQARFVKDEMLNNIGRGNTAKVMKNIAALGIIYPMSGEVLADVRSLITQEKRPTKFFDRYIQDLYSAGSFGMLSDFQQQLANGKMLEGAAGPAVGDAITYLETVSGMIAGDKSTKKSAMKDFQKQLLRSTGVGRIGVNVFFPPKSNTGKSSIESLIQWSAD